MNIDALIEFGKPTMNKTPKTKLETIKLTATRDGMHSELMTKVRLNRYDMKFMVNISEKYLMIGKPLSPGQNELYEKIVHKYRKQLRKLKTNYKDIIALPWTNGIVSPEVLNQKTYFRISDTNEMQLYFNFNKSQIEEVRALIHDDAGIHLNRGSGSSQNFGNGQKYDFNWDNTKKTWHGPFNVYLFKQLYEFALKVNVKIDSSVANFIESLDAAGTKEEWTPCIRNVNGRLYVNHITEAMLPMLETIDMSDITISNVERLTKFGLAAPEEFDEVSAYVNNASPFNAHVLKDASDVTKLKNYIDASGRKILIYVPEMTTRRDRFLESKFAELADCKTWGVATEIMGSENSPFAQTGDATTTAETFDKMIKEGYNTLVTTTPLTSLLRQQAQLGKFALKADKVIYLKLTETT